MTFTNSRSRRPPGEAADLRELGEDPVRLRQWAHRGDVERVGHSIYRFQQIPPTQLDPYKLATLWPAGRGVLSHETALELHELCDVNPDGIAFRRTEPEPINVPAD